MFKILILQLLLLQSALFGFEAKIDDRFSITQPRNPKKPFEVRDPNDLKVVSKRLGEGFMGVVNNIEYEGVEHAAKIIKDHIKNHRGEIIERYDQIELSRFEDKNHQDLIGQKKIFGHDAIDFKVVRMKVTYYSHFERKEVTRIRKVFLTPVMSGSLEDIALGKMKPNAEELINLRDSMNRIHKSWKSQTNEIARDGKPDNILIDKDFNAKAADLMIEDNSYRIASTRDYLRQLEYNKFKPRNFNLSMNFRKQMRKSLYDADHGDIFQFMYGHKDSPWPLRIDPSGAEAFVIKKDFPTGRKSLFHSVLASGCKLLKCGPCRGVGNVYDPG